VVEVPFRNPWECPLVQAALQRGKAASEIQVRLCEECGNLSFFAGLGDFFCTVEGCLSWQQLEGRRPENRPEARLMLSDARAFLELSRWEPVVGEGSRATGVDL
jgi:hypothetical protein